MDNEELDRRREQQEDEKMQGMLEKDSKKANKSKFKMIATRLAAIITAIQTILPIIIGIAVIGAILGAIIYIFDLEGDNSVSSAAVGTLFEDKEIIDIANAGGEGYYFKIDKTVKKKYLELINKAYHEGYYDGNIDEDAGEFIYDEDNPDIKEEELADWFLTNDYEPYLIKMIRAQIASSYPKLGGYVGEAGTEDKAGNKKDKDGNYVTQGVAEIQRTKMDEEGNPASDAIELKYLPYEEFKQMLQRTDESALEALNYFSFDEGGMLYYATYQRIKVTVNGVEVSNTISLHENPISYKNVTAMCSMPYNFLFALLQESENPEYIMKVIDLLMQDTELVLMIQDQMNIMTHTKVETSYHAQKTVTNHYRSVGNEETGYSWESSGSSESYSYPAGEPVVDTTITTTYTNTANVFIKKAKTWCMDFEQEATLIETDKPGEDVTTPEEHSQEELSGLGYFQVGSGSGSMSEPTGSGESTSETTTYISAGTLLYSTTERIDEKDFSWNISIVTEKRINYERFLGLWKNEKGEYKLDCQFDPNGKKVGYALPTDNATKSYPVDVIPQENGQNIDELIDLLNLSQDTQMQMQLMQYYWNIYMNDNIYDVDINGILDFINTTINTSIGGSALSNYIKAWENGNLWKYETGLSSNLPSSYLSEDGQYYIVYEDGSGGHNNIAYGIATFLSKKGGTVNHPVYGKGEYNWESIFSKYGINVRTLKTGDLVPVDAVKSAFSEILAKFEGIVDSYLSNHGITLSQTQRDALVSVCYQRGNIYGFAEGYNSSLNSSGEVDKELIRNNFYLTYNQMKPFDYNSKINDRKYANWYLFTEGIYLDRSGNEIKAIGGTLLECAKLVHDYMSDPSHLYYYCLAGGHYETASMKQAHRNAGLSRCGLNLNFSESQIPGKNGYRLTCCATYVSWVLDEAGYEVKLTHSAPGLARNLGNAGWQKINTYNELQAGDIVFMDTDGPNNGVITHVQIYVGDNSWYNAGNNKSIHTVAPEKYSASGIFVCAYRAPN